jgi:hypothetical protein
MEEFVIGDYMEAAVLSSLGYGYDTRMGKNDRVDFVFDWSEELVEEINRHRAGTLSVNSAELVDSLILTKSRMFNTKGL